MFRAFLLIQLIFRAWINKNAIHRSFVVFLRKYFCFVMVFRCKWQGIRCVGCAILSNKSANYPDWLRVDLVYFAEQLKWSLLVHLRINWPGAVFGAAGNCLNINEQVVKLRTICLTWNEMTEKRKKNSFNFSLDSHGIYCNVSNDSDKRRAPQKHSFEWICN